VRNLKTFEQSFDQFHEVNFLSLAQVVWLFTFFDVNGYEVEDSYFEIRNLLDFIGLLLL